MRACFLENPSRLHVKGGLRGFREIRLELMVMFGVMRMPQLRQWEWREGARELPEIELTGLGGLRKGEQLVGFANLQEFIPRDVRTGKKKKKKEIHAFHWA